MQLYVDFVIVVPKSCTVEIKVKERMKPDQNDPMMNISARESGQMRRGVHGGKTSM